MNYTVYELPEWDNLADYPDNTTKRNMYVKWMITGFEEEIFVAEGDEVDSGFLFMKRSPEEGMMDFILNSEEYVEYIKVMIKYRDMKKEEKIQYLN